MNEIKVFKSLLFLGLGFSVFYVLHHYVFKEDGFSLFGYLFPVGTSIIQLIGDYSNIEKRKGKKGFVVLKDSPFELKSFNGAMLSMIIIFYIQDSFYYWLTPLLLINLILIYLIKRRQIYYFGDWSIKNLSGTRKNILIKEIQSFDLFPNRLVVLHRDEDDDEDENERLIIRREQLEAPKSWYEFEKIALEFKEKVARKTNT